MHDRTVKCPEPNCECTKRYYYLVPCGCFAGHFGRIIHPDWGEQQNQRCHDDQDPSIIWCHTLNRLVRHNAFCRNVLNDLCNEWIRRMRIVFCRSETLLTKRGYDSGSKM